MLKASLFHISYDSSKDDVIFEGNGVDAFIRKQFYASDTDIGFIEDYVNYFCTQIIKFKITSGMTPQQKAKALHNWVVKKVNYDHADKNARKNHTEAGLFLNDKVVCEGYAKGYARLMNKAGLTTVIVKSRNHDWNKCKIGNLYFNIDVTWDDPEKADASNDCVPLDEIDEAEDMDRVLQFDAELKALIVEHQTFIEDLIRVQKVFAPFLECVHHRSEFLSNEETAEVLAAFMQKTEKSMHSYDKLKPSGTMTMTYQVTQDNNRPVLCEQYHFTTIGAFLYVELFKGLQNHYLPKRCGYCGRYFLLESAYFSDYCTREVEGMNGKRCRDLGHRKKYADKIKNDPVWLTYSRAYKAHYARFLKKKMTQAEFQVWADYALDLRQQALDGTLSFKEYQEEIRK